MLYNSSYKANLVRCCLIQASVCRTFGNNPRILDKTELAAGQVLLRRNSYLKLSRSYRMSDINIRPVRSSF